MDLNGDNAPKAIIELVDKDFNAKGQDSGPSSKKLWKKLAKLKKKSKKNKTNLKKLRMKFIY